MCGWGFQKACLGGTEWESGREAITNHIPAPEGPEDDDHGVLFRWALQQLGTLVSFFAVVQVLVRCPGSILTEDQARFQPSVCRSHQSRGRHFEWP